MESIKTDKHGGAALFVVLIFLVVIANLAFLALRSSSSEIRAASLFVDGARADELGRSIVSLTRYYISGDPSIRVRGGSFAAQFDVGKVTIDYVSESARVDVNQCPVALLEAILLNAGLDQDRVGRIAANLEQRRSAQKEGRYDSPFEIAQSWNLSEREARKIVPLLTTANTGGTIDPLLAGPIVLSALLDGSDTRVSDFEEKRMIGFPNADSVLAYFDEPVHEWLKIGADGPVRALGEVRTSRGLVRNYEAVFDTLVDEKSAKLYYWRPLN